MNETKTCTLCGCTKSIEDFAWRTKGVRRQSSCKDCQKAYSSANYARNKEKRKKRTLEYKKEQRALMRLEKSGKPCADCGQVFPYVCMDYDHLDSDEKRGLVCLMVSSPNKRQEEIAKCDLVCANCHRIRSAKRAGWL